MGKNDRKYEKEEEIQSEEMTLQEAKAFRASLNKVTVKDLNDQEKREAFRIFWAQEKAKYGKSKDLEPILWAHLKSVKLDQPDKFEAGIKHFGLTKVR